ncbi:type II toxin-antitoxin system RelE/ParE family toxin [Devosia salina]|uniref:Type II toxin-antitoxin system RelE/ParE family toxin n=1 Tax=Devosia salina TaxID=2860336 RepID=A0ABX8WHJ4_9HYPH|nr:type II toxin-antitoxin system RelE/ParE family toxin [Devosia salina]QYO76446.1 type II toxin-antitoxin system RelE/ParE family toxin [Devosia salina]
MRVVFSPKALRDLCAIGDFIGLENASRAATFVAELELACRSLSSESMRYALLEKPKGYRRMPIGNYLVLYQVTASDVRVVRVIHAARDMNELDL